MVRDIPVRPLSRAFIVVGGSVLFCVLRATAATQMPSAVREATCSAANVPARVADPKTLPVFPSAALVQGVADAGVTVQVELTASGSPQRALLLKSSGNSTIDSTAVQGALKIRYSPELHDCIPVSGTYQVRFLFDLDKRWKFGDLNQQATTDAVIVGPPCQDDKPVTLLRAETGGPMRVPHHARPTADPVVLVSVDDAGHVTHTYLERSSGNPQIDKSVLRLAASSYYGPSVVACARHSGTYTFLAHFHRQP